MASNSFLGTGWSFPPCFDKNTGTVQMVSDLVDIKESLKILLSTTIGERVMQPTYGCNLQSYVFQPLNANVMGIIKNKVTKAILYFEPRIIAQDVLITPSDSEDLIEGKFTITVNFTIPQTNSRFNFVYDFYTNEALTTISYL